MWVQVPVIAYLLSPLLKSSLRNHGNPVYLSGSVLEKDCSVMEPDDVSDFFHLTTCLQNLNLHCKKKKEKSYYVHTYHLSTTCDTSQSTYDDRPHLENGMWHGCIGYYRNPDMKVMGWNTNTITVFVQVKFRFTWKEVARQRFGFLTFKSLPCSL